MYGIKEEKDVHEEMTLEPLTDYSKFKAECETILSNFHDDDFITVTLRPATVCGYSPRQRLDVVVNILTNLAYHKGEISVFGGSQLRPNIHIEDMAEAYMVILDAPDEKVSKKVFNVGCENHSVLELAKTVQEVVSGNVKLVVSPTDDLRSYHVSSEKILKELGFATRHSIKQASIDLVQAFEKGYYPTHLRMSAISTSKGCKAFILNKLRIGLDFDNTLACYDEVFSQQAKKLNYLPEDWAGDKQSVKNELLKLPDGGLAWQKLQGRVYGPAMLNAVTFSGLAYFLTRTK